MLTITTTHEPATDLGYLLHKHPDRMQTFDLSFGEAHVFYPDADERRCTAALMLELDTIRLTRRGNQKVPQNSTLLKDYVNDRAYAAGSQLSQALNHVYRTAMSGRCSERPELAKTPIPLEARVESLRAPKGSGLITALFEPLGYEVIVETPPMDPVFPGWGEGIHHNVTIRSESVTLSELLNHLYVLLPALDNEKHYWIGEDEVKKLLQHGGRWLAEHPLQNAIQNRYLGYRRTLIEKAEADAPRSVEQDPAGAEMEETPETPENPLESLPDDPPEDSTEAAAETAAETAEETTGEATGQQGDAGTARPTEAALEKRLRLGELRIIAVLDEVRRSGAASVLDAGCGEGELLRRLADEPQVKRLTGIDVRQFALRRCWSRLSQTQKEKTNTLHGSLTYADPRLEGFEAAVAMEVVEHIDPERLEAFSAALLGIAHPGTIVMTTPNREYNVLFGNFHGGFRHRDHRFEWTRAEFRDWAGAAALKHSYEVRFEGIGEEHPQHGHPTQMAVFTQPAGDAQ